MRSVHYTSLHFRINLKKKLKLTLTNKTSAVCISRSGISPNPLTPMSCNRNPTKLIFVSSVSDHFGCRPRAIIKGQRIPTSCEGTRTFPVGTISHESTSSKEPFNAVRTSSVVSFNCNKLSFSWYPKSLKWKFKSFKTFDRLD